jgi:integrase
LRIILREAEAEGIIERDPLEKMEVMGKNSKIRDAFTLEELKLMFPQEREQLMKIWGEAKYATLFYILSITGMRQGEARALQWKDVFWDGGLVISKSVKFDRSIGSTKTQNVRVVLLTSRGIELLKQWKEESPYAEPEDYIFFSTRGDRVLCSQTIRHLLHEVCKKLSIKTEGRILVVHSFRHTFNTLMRRVLPQATLQAITGHSTEKMSEHYDHPTPNDLFNNIKGSQRLIEGVLE